MITTYLFDLDDTIIDASIYSRMYNEVISTLLSNLKISEIELQEVITRMKNDTGKPKVDTYELCKRLSATELYYDVFTKFLRHTYSLKLKNLPSIFKKIKAANKQIGIVSNSQERSIELILRRFNLYEDVDFIESGRKETMLFWINLQKRHDLDPETTLLVDDAKENLELAQHVGFRAVHVDDLNSIEMFKL